MLKGYVVPVPRIMKYRKINIKDDVGAGIISIR